MEKDIKQLFGEYMNECRFSTCLRPETIRGYRAVFDLFLKVMPEVCVPKDLTTEILNEFFKRIQTRQRIVGRNTLKTGVRESTIKTQRSKLNVFFIWLCKNHYMIENPLENIDPPSVSYDDFRRLTDSQVNKIYSVLSQKFDNSFTQRRDIMMVSLLLHTGIRKGEFISLQVKDIDIVKAEITIRGETSKSKRTKTLKMHPTLVLHLKDYFRERNIRKLKTEYLIASNREDKRLSLDGLKHWTNGLIKKSGVKFHLHMFRHTFACKLAEADVNLFKIQKMMGHVDIRMTMKYTRSLKTEEMAEDVGKISF